MQKAHPQIVILIGPAIPIAAHRQNTGLMEQHSHVVHRAQNPATLADLFIRKRDMTVTDYV